MTEKKSVTVNIYGNEYTLKGEADPQYIAELAKQVDSKMNEIGKRTSAPAAKVAILACMNIADEFQRLERAKLEHLKLIETLEKNLLEMKKSSDGSLQHTLELKEQLNKLKSDSSESHKKLEDTEKELPGLRRQLEEAHQKAEKQDAELQDIKREFERVSKDAAELQNLQKEVQVLKSQAEKLRSELAEEKKKVEATQEKLAEEKKKNETVQLDLTTAKNELNQVWDELAKTEDSLTKSKSAPKTAPPVTFNEEKLQALFKKIDAILE